MMKKYFVICNPIDHSLSPKLHNYWLKENNIDAIYDKKKHKMDEIIDKVRSAKMEIIDISTEEGNLEDVFIDLTKS